MNGMTFEQLRHKTLSTIEIVTFYPSNRSYRVLIIAADTIERETIEVNSMKEANAIVKERGGFKMRNADFYFQERNRRRIMKGNINA